MGSAPAPLDILSWVTQALQAEHRALSDEMDRRHGELLKELGKAIDAAQREALPRPAADEDYNFMSPKASAAPAAAKDVTVELATIRGSSANWSAASGSAESGGAPLGTPTSAGAAALIERFTVLKEGEEDHAAKKKKTKLRTHIEEEAEKIKKRSTLHGKFEAIVESVYFETVFAVLIIMNTLVMAVEAQHNGLDSCFNINFPDCNQAAEALWPGAGTIFIAIENTFGVLFTLEISSKVLAQRCSFLCSWWNWLDSLIITGWMLSLTGDLKTAINPMILRLVRMFRLLRLLRLVRTFQVFDALHLMIAALKASLAISVWMTVFLCLIMLTSTLTLTTWFDSYYKDESIPEPKRQQVYMYFGTFSRGFLSMFELTLGNWVAITRVLHENVSEWFGVVVMIYRVLVGEAIIKVVTGVFMYETFKCAQADDEMMIVDKSRQIQRHSDKMKLLMNEADDSGDGYLDHKEFTESLRDPRIKAWLAAMEIPVHQAGDMFKMLETSGDNKLSHEELVTGLARLKGPARAFEMQMVQNRWQKMDVDMQRLQDRLDKMADASGFGAGKFGRQIPEQLEGQLSKLDKLDQLEGQVGSLAGKMLTVLEESRRIQQDIIATGPAPPQPPVTAPSTLLGTRESGSSSAAPAAR